MRFCPYPKSPSYLGYKAALRTLVLLAVMVLVGCFEVIARVQAEESAAAESVSLLPDQRFKQAVDSLIGTDWYGIYFQGKKVGYATNSLKREKTPSGPELRSDLSAHMTLHSLGNAVQLNMELRWRFDGKPPYRLIEFVNRMKTGDDVSTIRIEREDQEYRARIHQGNETRIKDLQSFELTLEDVLAVETWLQQQPPIGEKIRYADLDTETLSIAEASAKLLNIESAMVNGIEMTYYTVLQKPAAGPEMTFLYGRDGKPYTMRVGDAFKFQLEPMKIAVESDKPIDLFFSNIVRIDTALGDPANVVRLKVAIDDRSGSTIREAPGQSIEFDTENKRYIVTITPGRGSRIKPTVEEIDQNLAATTEIPVDHPRIVSLARQAVLGAKTTVEKVARLVRFVQTYIEDDYHANPLTLLDILDKRKGDCSEHARLFTALARALSIPCRDVSGLMYFGDTEKGFYPHAWNEVVIDGYWHPVDPTWGQTTIDATHIRFSVDENEMFQIIGMVPDMKIVVLDFVTQNKI